jgi:hypothetical protein
VGKRSSLDRARFNPLTPDQPTQMIPGQVGGDREQKTARIPDRFWILDARDTNERVLG